MSPFASRRARGLGIVAGLMLASAFAGTALAGAVRAPEVTPERTVATMGAVLAGVRPEAMPAVVPGTRVAVKDASSAQSYSLDANTMIRYAWFSGGYYAYAASAATVEVFLDLPVGAVVRQLDVYAYATSSTTIDWETFVLDPTTGSGLFDPQPDIVGSGVLHASTSIFNIQPAAITIKTGPTYGFLGLVVQYTMPTNVLVPITPVRVLDTRFAGLAGKVGKGSPRTIDVKDAINVATGAVTTVDAIPAGAVAVAYNVTVTAQTAGGYLALVPGTGTTVTASAINWTSANSTIANGGIVMLGTGAAERRLTIVVGGGALSIKTHVILDITGYYISES